MKLIKPYTKILTPIDGNLILQTIESVARTCYKSEDKINEDSAPAFAKRLILSGHEAMLEFVDIVVKFVCDRGVSHEIVRHRLASYAQESTRYCNYSTEKYDNEITFVIPPWSEMEPGRYNYAYAFPSEEGKMSSAWFSVLVQAEIAYTYLIKNGWQAQQARSVLPNSLKTEINVKMNLRQWRHFFKLRCAPAAHPQMRELTIPLLDEFRAKIPVLFDDITF